MNNILATLLIAFGLAGIAGFLKASLTIGKPWESPNQKRSSLIIGLSITTLIVFGAIAVLGIWMLIL